MEVNGGEAGWYVDTWAVLEGRLFASLRPPDSIVAQSTVFVSVPDLEPVPVGRISTALRAGRAGFQEGLRGPDGNEIRFDDLRQIKTLVKSGYLGGGLGPGAPTAPGRPFPAPDAGTGGAYLDVIIRQFEGLERWLPGTLAPWDALADVDADGLRPLIRAFAEASIIAWAATIEEADASLDMRGLAAWVAALVQAGVFDDAVDNPPVFLGQLGDLVASHGAAHIGKEMQHTRWWSFIGYGGPFSIATPNTTSVTVTAPTPKSDLWDSRLRRVDEHLLLAASRPSWLHRFPSMANLAAVVLAVMVPGARGEHLLAGGEAPAESALRRLRRELERPELPDAAEEALDWFVQDRLEGRPPGRSAPDGGESADVAAPKIDVDWEIIDEPETPPWVIEESPADHPHSVQHQEALPLKEMRAGE